MNNPYDMIYQKLLSIYDLHRRRHKNPNSKQMCCMWSTSNLPDTLESTRPICDLEKAFDICLDEGIAIEIYDMDLDEAAKKIMEMQEGKC